MIEIDIEAARQAIGEKLSPRQWHIFLRTAAEVPRVEIAKEYGISVQAVYQGTRNLMRRLGIGGKVELGMFLAQRGIAKIKPKS